VCAGLPLARFLPYPFYHPDVCVPSNPRKPRHTLSSPMSRLAKTTLLGSLVLSAGIIYGVHYMQRQEAEVPITIYANRGFQLLTPLIRQCFRAFYATTNEDETKCAEERKNWQSHSGSGPSTKLYNKSLRNLARWKAHDITRTLISNLYA
jgi:hypothetical protein